LPLFEGRIFSATEVARGKPAPDVFLHAARRMNAVPERSAVVEDSINGVLAGCAAGMTVLGYGATCGTAALAAAGAHHTFAAMDELLALLE
jgi:beta-phosphoglucomutase-like phosphatase (HAD superfamily)